MSGPSDHVTELPIRWADAVLLDLAMSYDTIEVKVLESGGNEVTIVARGQIGLELVGFWDEVVIEDGTLVESHPFADRCLESISERLGWPAPASGSPERNRGRYATLVLALSDGSTFRCAAAEFVVERLSTRSPAGG